MDEKIQILKQENAQLILMINKLKIKNQEYCQLLMKGNKEYYKLLKEYNELYEMYNKKSKTDKIRFI